MESPLHRLEHLLGVEDRAGGNDDRLEARRAKQPLVAADRLLAIATLTAGQCVGVQVMRRDQLELAGLAHPLAAKPAEPTNSHHAHFQFLVCIHFRPPFGSG
jgi:hypothetical protein